MTVQRMFVSWQTNPKKPDPKKCSPLCGSLWRHLHATWGGQFLGCYNSRPIVGGTSLSSHASGAALDWRYQNPGPGRTKMLNEVLPFLINNSLELGIEAIHDYAGKRIWRPPGSSGRPTTPSPQCGWKPSSGVQMNPKNTWLHIEVLPSRWYDERPVAQMVIPPKAPIADNPPPPLESHIGELLMALSDQQLQTFLAQHKEMYDRVMGSLPGTYSTEQRALDPPPEGRLFVLDNMDGNYIVQMLQMIAAKLGI